MRVVLCIYILVVDNFTLMKEQAPPFDINDSGGLPVIYNGYTYTPKYSKDGSRVVGYTGKNKNLIIYIGQECTWLKNSIHKYLHNNQNWTDLYRDEIKMGIDKISNESGIDWSTAIVKEVEVGCNIETNPVSAVNALLSYKHKNFQPMIHNGKKYGVFTEVQDYYRIKGYNKTLQVQQADKINIKKHLFRWEMVMKYKQLVRLFGSSVQLGELLQPCLITCLIDQVLQAYKDSVKMQQIMLHKLTAHEKLVFAAMQHEAVAADLKMHHRDAHKKYRRKFKEIMANPEICVVDDQYQKMETKFSQLISGFPIYNTNGFRGITVSKGENNN